jgi:hypothetical protein
MDPSPDVNARDRLMLRRVQLQLAWIRERVRILERRGLGRREAIHQAVSEQMTRESLMDDTA